MGGGGEEGRKWRLDRGYSGDILAAYYPNFPWPHTHGWKFDVALNNGDTPAPFLDVVGWTKGPDRKVEANAVQMIPNWRPPRGVSQPWLYYITPGWNRQQTTRHTGDSLLFPPLHPVRWHWRCRRDVRTHSEEKIPGASLERQAYLQRGVGPYLTWTKSARRVSFM